MVGEVAPAQLDGGRIVWGARQLAASGSFTLPPQTRLEFEPAPGRKFEFDTSVDGGTAVNVVGPDRVELRLEGRCAQVAGARPFSLDCGPFELRAPILRRYEHVVSVILFDPVDAVVSTGRSAITRDRHQTLQAWSPVDSWAEPITAPPPFDGERVNAATVWDPLRKQLVVFGGRRPDGTRLGDTLIWDGTSWSSPTLSTSPPPRSDAAFAFDPVRGRAVLFGGLAGDTALLGDTWEWDGSAWQQQHPALSPSPRAQAGLGWDGTRDELLLFSGYAQYDSWTWNGTRWLELTAGFTPQVRPPYALTWDPSSRLLVIVGAPTSLYSSAVWDGTAWSNVDGIAPMFVRSAVGIEGGVFALASVQDPALVLDAGARRWLRHTMPVLSGPGVPAADGGIRQFSRGLMRGWAEGPRLYSRWVRTAVLPAEDFVSAAEFEGQVFAIASNDAGVASTWRFAEDGGTDKLASGPRGKLVVQGGVLWLLGAGAAWTWDAGWNPTPWSSLDVGEAVAARDGGFFVLSKSNNPFRAQDATLVQVDTTGTITSRFGDTTLRPLIPMRGDLPFSLHNGTFGVPVGVTSWNEHDGGWTLVAEAVSFQQEILHQLVANEVLGQDGRGRTYLASKAPSNDNTTFIFDPWRPNGAYCARGEQCTSGNCVDGRCCDSTCACGVCSAASGATEDGVCQQRPVEECTEPTPEPPPAKQCGCGSVGWVALPAALLLRRRRR